MMDLSSEALQEVIEDTLECPICLEIMTRPIYQCGLGHSLCQACRKKMRDRCPYCKEHLSDTRNIIVEKLADSYLRPCKFTSNGCEAKLIPSMVQVHELCCPHLCYPCAEKGCGWMGSKDDLASHVKDQHLSFRVAEDTGPRGAVETGLFFPDCNVTSLVHAHEELFWFRVRNRDTTTGIVTVQCLGNLDIATRFLYDIEFTCSAAEHLKINFERIQMYDMHSTEDLRNIQCSKRLVVLYDKIIEKPDWKAFVNYKLLIYKAE